MKDEANEREIIALRQQIAELQAVQSRCQEIEETYRILVEHSLQGLTIYQDGSFVFANPAVSQITGYSREDILSFSMDEFNQIIHPEDQALLWQRTADRLAGKPAPNRYEFRIRRKDGEIRWIELFATRTEYKNKPAIQTTYIDITSRKQAETELAYLRDHFEELADARTAELQAANQRLQQEIADRKSMEIAHRESEIRYRELFNHMTSGVSVFRAVDDGADFILEDMNKRGQAISQMNRAEVIGRSVQEVFPGIEAMGLLAVFRRVWQSGQAEHHSPVLYQDDRLSQWVENYVYKLPSGEIVAVYNDVTEPRRVRLALRESEEQYHITIDAMSDYIHVVDRDLRLVLYNEAFRRAAADLLGVTGNLVGRDLFEVLLFATDETREKYHEILHTGQAYDSEIKVDLAVGPMWFEVRQLPIRDEAKRVYRILTIVRNITDRKQAEIRLKETMAELKRSNAELEQFAYIASHDLQEPLRKIQTFGDRLQTKLADQLDEKSDDYLARLLNATDRMRSLINDLLAYSRVMTKARPFVPLDLNRLIREVISDLEIQLEQSGGQIEVGVLPIIQADPLQMRQVFQNLISNALKFRREEEPPLVRIAAKSLPSDSLVQIEVVDNGIGFDEKYLDRIFGPFQRLYGRQRYPGTGMGLAIVRKIIERHHGHITAHSQPARGAAFILTLPVKQE